MRDRSVEPTAEVTLPRHLIEDVVASVQDDFGPQGGLLSDCTIRCSDELRLALARVDRRRSLQAETRA